jgi:multidrug transporter EmrE-like cation transporter
LPVGTAYAVWVGGALCAAGILFLGETASPLRIGLFWPWFSSG